MQFLLSPLNSSWTGWTNKLTTGNIMRKRKNELNYICVENQHDCRCQNQWGTIKVKKKINEPKWYVKRNSLDREWTVIHDEDQMHCNKMFDLPKYFH